MLPVETLRQILLQLSRDDLDAVELVNNHLRSILLTDTFIRWGPLRALLSLNDRSVHEATIRLGKLEIEVPMTGALLKDTFVQYVDLGGRNESTLRWFLTLLPRMRMSRLDLTVPAITGDFQEQLFAVLGSSRPCYHCPPDDVVSLLFREKLNVDNDAPPDVVVGPRSPETHSGYERSLYMTNAHLNDGGVKQLVAALREKAVNATTACPPFIIHIAGATLDVHELPQMRHLNRVTGQHFVVDSGEGAHVTIKCITVLQPAN